MTPREIIAAAWSLTSRERPLKRWGFFSSFFETLLNVKLVGYQFYFLHAYLVGEEVGFFDDFIWLYDKVPRWAFFTITGAFLLLLLIEFIVPKLAKGAIIGLAAKAHKGEKLEGGFVLALYNFFPIFAIHEFLVLASWSLTTTLSSLILRYVESDLKFTMLSFVLFFFVLSNILKFFFSFAEPAVVIRRLGIFEAMGHSFKLIVSYIGQIMFLLMLLIIISLRVLINTMVVLILPVIIVGFLYLLLLVLSPIFSYLIASIVGFALIIAASMLFAYLHVFNEAVWTITYMELKKRKDLDHIE